MGRVTTIVSTAVLATGVVASIAIGLAGPASRRTGRQLYGHRFVLERLDGAAEMPPDLVWLGDSTLMNAAVGPGYPYLIQHDLLDPAGLRSLVVAAPGFDFFAYWTLASRVCELHPAVVVVVANLRDFTSARTVRLFRDLVGEIDWGQVVDAARLPYASRGLTLPGIVLARALRTRLGSDVFLTLEGLRRDAQDAPAWAWLGPEEPARSVAENLRAFLAALGERNAAYDQPFDAGHPLVRFVEATVERLVRCGSRVLVLVPPIPWERLAETDDYEPSRVAARIATLEHAVTARGGRLVDLHHALTRDAFRDTDCHTTARGTKTMVDLVAFPVLEALVGQGVRPRPAAVRPPVVRRPTVPPPPS